MPNYMKKNYFFFVFYIISNSSLLFCKTQENTSNFFYVDNSIKDRISFWEKIFYVFPVSSYIIHDQKDYSIIIDVIDIKVHIKTHKLQNYPKKKTQKKLVNNYLKRYELALKRFASENIKARKYGEFEERIFHHYSQTQNKLMKLFQNKIKLHVQQGLSDEIRKAHKRSQKYLPEIERIFKEYDLPAKLTRIPFIESMFQSEVVSKSGAVGMWQFMPSTAKKYLILNQIIDERYSPLKSSHAAAKYFKDTYKYFDSWPLVVSSYNHGLTGILNARDTLKTNRIEYIIEHYKSSSYKYASRNYYPEFIAINNIVDRLEKPTKNKKQKTKKYLNFKLKEPLSLFEIVKETQTDPFTILKHNPCLKNFDFKKHYYQKLPKNYSFIIPKAKVKSRFSSTKLHSFIL